MEKTNFIKNEIFIMTIMAAFAHNKVYKDNVAENEKMQFRSDIKSFLIKLEDKYKNKITESEHLVILNKLKKDIENVGRVILNGSLISFGTVQKILNLYLKYLWCLGSIAEPPNCPIDRIILNKVKDYKTTWTKMGEKEYCIAIAKIKSVKGDRSIAEWELGEFKRK